MLGLLLALQLSATPALSPQAQALIAPVAEAVATEQARQAALPPPKTDAERLERMGALDQVGRRAMSGVKLDSLPADQRKPAFQAMWAPVEAVDRANQAALLTMVPPEGWFLKSRYGEEAAAAAFHIVQHSGLDLWRRFVPVLEPLVAAGEVEGQSFALMYDRLAMNEGRPQRYGSQFKCVDGRHQMHPVEDPAKVDELRRGMGMKQTLKEYAAMFEKLAPPCIG